MCVSAVDDTDKSSESVESTVLEHVTASADADFDRIRFEVPVSISDNDGHYLWGFGSNVYRQLGNDAVGPASILPAAITGSLDSKSQNRGGSKGESHSEKNKHSSISSDEGSNSDSKFDEEGGSSSRAVTLGTSPQAIRSVKKVGKRTSFISNAKQSKPSMLFASVAAGRHTTITTQTNGNTTMYGRNDGLNWFDCRTMIDGPPINTFSRSIGNSKTYIVTVSAGSFHCAALTVDGQLLTWGRNDCGQLGIGKHGDTKEVKKVEDSPRKKELDEDPVAEPNAGFGKNMMSWNVEQSDGMDS